MHRIKRHCIKKSAPASTTGAIVLRLVFAAKILLIIFGSTGAIAKSVHFWNEGPGGTTRDFYNMDARVKWRSFLGDWIDRNESLFGNSAYLTERLNNPILPATVTLDVTEILQKWAIDESANNGFFIRASSGSSSAHIFSKESNHSSPILVIDSSDTTYTLRPDDDTYLDRSTYRSLGDFELMKVSADSPALLFFNLDELDRNTTIQRASLKLKVKKIHGSNQLDLSVFLVAPPNILKENSNYDAGLSNAYPMDKGIEQHPDVLYSNSFDNNNWMKSIENKGNLGGVGNHNATSGYEPICGNSLRATIPSGQNHGLNSSYKFAPDSAPSEAYARYYLRLNSDWDQQVSGGKLPGFAGTYGKAGWGGRRGNGFDGWSARGSFGKTAYTLGDNPRKLTSVGSYVYHLDQPDAYGNNWVWDEQGTTLLENNRWYSIEQYVKLNDPGRANGKLKAWVDGSLAFNKGDLEFRKSEAILIEEFWFNFYHGGLAPTISQQSLYIDNVVIAKSYIGPGSLVDKTNGDDRMSFCN